MILLLFFISNFAFAKIPQELEKTSKQYQNVKTLSSLFTQSAYSASTKGTKISSGVLFFKKPGSFRWETVTPDSSLMISDGKTLWFYTPPFEEGERGQLIVQKSTQQDSKIITKLLMGDFSFVNDFKSVLLKPNLFELTPKKNSQTVSKIKIETDLKKNLISKIMLFHKGGNSTEIVFDELKLNPEITEGLFTFTAPKDTDIISQ